MRIPDFSAVRVLVAGDVMLDRYWYGDTSRVSPEAPVPVVHIGRIEDRPGGAANVALGLTALGAGARLVASVADDEAGAALTALLAGAGVEPVWSSKRPAHTTTKLRVMSQHQQMIRLDFEERPETAPALGTDDLDSALAGVHAMVLSDYGKGALADPQPLIRAARESGVPVLIDPKRADYDDYADATVLTPNHGEFERAVGRCRDEAELVERGQALLTRLDIGALLITRGPAGMTLIVRDAAPAHIAAQAQEVFDVTGAGDTAIAVLAAALGAGEGLGHAAGLANLAAGVAVGKLGTATVSRAELRAAVHRWQPLDDRRGVTPENELLPLIRTARERQDLVVMTNGCFDLLHPGHVAYLQQAAALGDRLVVAVNDDDSVRRLKGDGRPVNPLAHRMAVLAGIAGVDWVVPFSEDTPARLIEAVAPDVLVKGGDYAVTDIAGHESVLARGGRVEVLPLLEGYSSTAIVERLRGNG